MYTRLRLSDHIWSDRDLNRWSLTSSSTQFIFVTEICINVLRNLWWKMNLVKSSKCFVTRTWLRYVRVFAIANSSLCRL